MDGLRKTTGAEAFIDKKKGAHTKKKWDMSLFYKFGPVILLLLLILGIYLIDPRALSFRMVRNIGSDASPLFFLIMGGTFVVLIGGIDLSAPALTSLCTIIFTRFLPDLGVLTVPVVLLAGAFLGAAQGYLQAKLQISSFVVTLGGMAIFSGLALYLSGASTMPLSGSDAFVSWLSSKTLGFPNSLLSVLIAFAVLSVLMRFTLLGQWIYATGSNEVTTRIVGIDTVIVRVMAFSLSGLFASLAGLAFLAQTGFGAPTIADSLLLPALTAIVVGGISITGGSGKIWMAFIGGMIVVTVRLGTVVLNLGPAIQNILFGLGIIFAIAITIDRQRHGVVK